ncbi:OmpA family protein [Flavobacterium sp. xlx-214]|uniref:OmpA family protein n=1 Tax=unclassified Flavobacterium TaxID=196869 RepID=UPI0013D0F5BD|nr:MULTISPECIES: OmpA family protein [unclassified Flavobacterium]MBA5791163.1 OmpA family protein [Flavobacterium sp. xlx-221]QMI83667.1 OmpA family protein [Flavobacterium sp. xlx-214]
MRLYLLLFCLITFKGFSQQKQSFYFNYNESEFTATEKQKIDDWIKLHPNLTVLKVEGFSDWVGNNQYNEELSNKRIQAVLNYLTSKVKIDNAITKKSFGKQFKQNEIQDLNRRVDIYFSNEVVENKESKKLDEDVHAAKIGEKIKLKNLNFNGGSDVFKSHSYPVLKELLQTMKSTPTLKIEIQGHICCYNDSDSNDVSEKRALAVYNFLIKNGIDKKRLKYKSFGGSQPIYAIPEQNDEEREVNRRVEILILEK